MFFFTTSGKKSLSEDSCQALEILKFCYMCHPMHTVKAETEDSEVIKFEQAVPTPSSSSSVATIPLEQPQVLPPASSPDPLPENNPWDLVPDQYKLKQHSR